MLSIPALSRAGAGSLSEPERLRAGSLPKPILKQKAAIGQTFVLAGAAGIEPATRVLETLVIPFNYAPIC